MEIIEEIILTLLRDWMSELIFSLINLNCKIFSISFRRTVFSKWLIKIY